MPERKAIVFNCFYNGLNVIRTLGKHGVSVIALDFHKNIGTRSRYANYLQCPDPSKNENKFIKFLINLGKSFTSKPVIIPTNDIWVLAASKHYDELKEYYHLCFSRFETVDMILNKNEFYRWAVEKEVSVPGTWKYSQIDQIEDDHFPVIVKPENRRPLGESPDIYQKLDNNRIKVADNKQELKDYYETNKDISQHLITQEYVKGMSDSMYTVGIYSKNGKVRAIFTGRKVRGYPADYGDCVVGQVESMPDNVIDEVKVMCAELNYTGIAEFEYKKDSVTGSFRLIEINPRSWSWVGITPACGVNLPQIAFDDLRNEYSGPEILYSNKPDGSIKYVRLLEDMKNSLVMYKKKGCPVWHRSLFSWIKSLKCEKLVIAEWEWGDSKPLFFTTINMLYRIIKR